LACASVCSFCMSPTNTALSSVLVPVFFSITCFFRFYCKGTTPLGPSLKKEPAIGGSRASYGKKDYSPLMVTPIDNRFMEGPAPSFKTPVIW
jgi:hypothetical protein